MLGFVLEIIGRIILSILAVYTFSLIWWLPLVIAPIFWQIWDKALALALGRISRIFRPLLKRIADGITLIFGLAYIVFSTVSFGMNMGHWYWWVIGAIIGIVVEQFLGLLWPIRWHFEKIEGNL